MLTNDTRNLELAQATNCCHTGFCVRKRLDDANTVLPNNPEPLLSFPHNPFPPIKTYKSIQEEKHMSLHRTSMEDHSGQTWTECLVTGGCPAGLWQIGTASLVRKIQTDQVNTASLIYQEQLVSEHTTPQACRTDQKLV